MFDKILTQLKETRDRQAVMILLQGLDVPMAVLTIKSDLATGELWIEKGKYIVYAKVLPNGDGGLMDMLRVLAIAEGEFALEVRDEKPPPCQVSIQLSEVVADEHAVARKIKNVLWPVEESGAEETKADESSAKKRKRNKKKTVEELEITHVRGAATDQALEAYVKEKSEAKAPAEQAADKPEGKPEDKPAESKQQEKSADKSADDKLQDKPADNPADKPAELAKAEGSEEPEKSPVEPTTGLQPEVAEAIGDRLDELFSDGDKDDKAKSQSQPQLADAAWQKIDQILSDKPAAGERADAAAQSSSSLSSLFDDDDESEAEATPSTAASTPAAAGAARQGLTAFELNAQMISAAAKKGLRNTWEGLTAKQQAHYVAMSALLGEEPEQFYAEAEAHSQMTEESLAEQRKEETAALAQALAEDPEAFQVGKPKIIDPKQTNDELKSRRAADYEALKLFYAEEPAKFEDKVGLDDTIGDGGLTDFQKRILEISSEEGHGRDQFDQVDEKLTAGPDIRPAWDLGEIPSTHALNAIPTPSPTTADDVQYVAQKVDSPYADSAPEISLTTSLRKKLSLEAEQQSTDLITRIARATHLVPAGEDADFKRQPMLRFVVAGLAGTILIPLSGFVLWHYYDAQTNEEVELRRQAAEMAERSLAKQSMVVKPQEPFRMPAAPPQSPLSGGNSGGSTAGDQGVSAAQKSASFTWHPPKEGNGPTPDQVVGATQEMKTADQFLAAGNRDRAVAVYIQAIHKYPSNALLRAKAARVCISLHQYKQAYMICFTGLDACQTRADFDMLVSIIKEIP
ncbi:MAG TPA: hypothetical protein V6D22_19870 [Candidatus Obscuribacterales bacterium]